MSEPAPNAAPEEKVPMPLSNENSTTDPTPQQNQDVTTTQNNSGALSMFAQPTSCDVNDVSFISVIKLVWLQLFS